MDFFKQDTSDKFNAQKEDFKEKLGNIDTYYSEKFEEMGNEIDAVKKMAKDAVNAKERELQAQMDKQVDSIRRFVDSNIDDMVNERRETL